MLARIVDYPHPMSMVRFATAAAVLGSLLVVSAGSAQPRVVLKAPVAANVAAVVETALVVHTQSTNGVSKSCPANMALVGHSCVDKYEGSLVEIADDGTESSFSPYTAPNGHHVRAVSRAGVVPQAHISLTEATKACKASHKRLCRAEEWKTACKGPEQTKFPYGESRIANACVDTNRTSPMEKLHGGNRDAKALNDPQANQQANTLEKTGSAAQCTNGYGVHDMVGNIHEWTSDGTFRGGYYLDTKMNGEGCDYKTTAHSKSYYDYSTGFRCCADADTLSADAD
jgi:hypothetical protein